MTDEAISATSHIRSVEFERRGEAVEIGVAISLGTIGISQSGSATLDEQGTIVDYKLGTFTFVANSPASGAYFDDLISISDAHTVRGGGWFNSPQAANTRRYRSRLDISMDRDDANYFASVAPRPGWRAR